MRFAGLVLLGSLGLGACGGKVVEVGRGGAEAEASAPPRPPADPNDVWLAFATSGSLGSGKIYVMRADGSDRRALDLGVEAASPAFSADGAKLAFAGPGGIWVRDLTNGTSRQVTHGQDNVPAWSPDGKLIAFTRDVDIYVVGADGSGERPYIKGPPPGEPWYANYGHPVFTHDGASLIFDHFGAVQIGAVDGSGVRDLYTDSGGGAPMVAISPDGATLVFAARCAGWFVPSFVLVPLANAGDACRSATTLGSAPFETRPAWSANGLIAYVDVLYELKIVPASGGTPATILDTKQSLGGVYLGEIAWSPPGTVFR